MNEKDLRFKIGVSWKLSAYEEIEEIGYDFMDVFGADLMGMPETDFYDAVKTVERGGLPCCNICLYSPPGLQMMGDRYSPAEVEDYARRMCVRCAALGITGIGIGSGHSRTVPENYSLQKAEVQLLEAFRITAGVAAEYDICLMIEPLNRFICNHMLSTKDTADFIDRVSMENVRMVFDFHHFVIMNERLEDLKRFIPYIRSVQFNEIDTKNGEKRFLTEENAALYKEQLATIVDFGYTGAFCIEAICTDNFYEDAKRSLPIARQVIGSIT